MGSSSKTKTSLVSDDELLDQCIRENSKCFASQCTRSIRVIGLSCRLCTHVFCTQHQLPEDHGCGHAVIREAHKKSAPPASNAKKSSELQGKMEKKLQQMKKDRQKKGK